MQCHGGEIMDYTLRKCISCPVGFYCVDGVSMSQCPPGATTTLTRSINAKDCFCVVPFVATPVSGTVVGFVCQMPMLDIVNTTIPSVTVNGGGYILDAHLTIDAIYSKLRIEHRPAGPIIHTVVVLNSTSSCMHVHLFVYNTTGVHVVMSKIALTSTAVIGALELFNTVLLVGSVDFDVVDEDRTVTFLIMIMDTLQGLVYHGVVKTMLHMETHELSLVSQDWNPLFQFGNMIFYTTLSVPAQFALIACQTRSSASVAAEEDALKLTTVDTVQYNHYDIIRFDLLLAEITITSFKTSQPFDEKIPPFLRMDLSYQHVSFRVPGDGNEIFRIQFNTWQEESSDMVLQTPQSPVLPHTQSIQTIRTSEFDQDHSKVMLSHNMLVSYRDLFQNTFVFAQHTNGILFGIVELVYKHCVAGAWAHPASFFQCVCLPGYRPRLNEPSHKGQYGCVACSLQELCPSGLETITNISKCAVGYKIYESRCVLCDKHEYCQHGQAYNCPDNSWTLAAQGAYDPTTCVCKPGYYTVATKYSSFTCQECNRPFYCIDSKQHTCPQNMSTNLRKAHTFAQCQCWQGFVQHIVPIGGDLMVYFYCL